MEQSELAKTNDKRLYHLHLLARRKTRPPRLPKNTSVSAAFPCLEVTHTTSGKRPQQHLRRLHVSRTHLGGVGEPLLLLLQELAKVRADGGVNEHRLVEVGVTLRRRLEGRDQPHRRVLKQTLEKHAHNNFRSRAENARRVLLGNIVMRTKYGA